MANSEVAIEQDEVERTTSVMEMMCEEIAEMRAAVSEIKEENKMLRMALKNISGLIKHNPDDKTMRFFINAEINKCGLVWPDR